MRIGARREFASIDKMIQQLQTEERKEKNMAQMDAVRSTKYPLSEVAEAVQKVLTEHAEDLGLEKMAKELIHSFTEGDKVHTLEEEVEKNYNGSYLQKLHELQKISFQEYQRSGIAEVGPGTALWPEIMPEYVEISKEGVHIGDTPLEKGERYLFFCGCEGVDNLIDMSSVSKYLPKEFSNSLVVYDEREITVGVTYSKLFSTVDEMIGELKVKEAIESERGRESGKEKTQKNEKKSQEGRASVKGKLEKNKEAVEKNQTERKEPKHNREEAR